MRAARSYRSPVFRTASATSFSNALCDVEDDPSEPVSTVLVS